MNEEPYPHAPLASRKAPLRLVGEAMDIANDLNKARDELARLLETPALPGNEDRRLYAIYIALEEIARIEHLLETA